MALTYEDYLKEKKKKALTYNDYMAQKSQTVSLQDYAQQNKEQQNNKNNFWSNIRAGSKTFGLGVENTTLQGYKAFSNTAIKNSNQYRVADFNEQLMQELKDKGKINQEEYEKAQQSSIIPTKKTLEEYQKEKEGKVQNVINTNIQEIQDTANQMDSEVGRIIVGEIMPTLGQQAVFMGSSLINPAFGILMATESASGSYYDDAKARGMNDEDAWKFGGVMGAVEGLTEQIGINNFKKAGIGIKALIKGGAKEGTKQAVTGTLKSVLKDYGIGIADNFIQEAITDPIEEIVATNIGGKDKANWDGILEKSLRDGIMGAITSAITGGANVGIQSCVGYVQKVQNGQQPTQQETQKAVKEASKVVNIQEELKNNVNFEVNQLNNAIQNSNQLQATDNALQQANIPQQQTNQEQNKNGSKTNVESQNQRYIYEETDNEDINQLRQDIVNNTKWNNSDTTHSYINMLEQIIKDKGVKIRIDNTLDSKVNGTYKDGVITINPNSKRAGEFIAVHELTHAIGTKSMVDMIKTYREGGLFGLNKNTKFDTQVQKLLDNYNENEINEEALADISGQLFGTQEFIENIRDNNPTMFQKIYNEIKYLYHQVVGYKNQSQFVEDLYNKWTSAYNDKSNKLNQINKFSINSNFEIEYDNWDKKDRNGNFIIGRTSEALKSIGLNDYDIVMDKTKILDILNKHPEMNDNLIKQIPNILENPTLILKSQTVKGRITVFSELKATDNKPILVAMELNPAENKNNIEKIYKVASAYGRQNVKKMQDWLNDSNNILYIDKQKNRTMNWLNGLGLQLPVPNNSSSSINNITSSNENVNTITKNSMQESVNNSDSFNLQDKKQQFRIIEETNPMKDNYHTGIRNESEIKTYQEALNNDGYQNGNITPDYTEDMVNKAKETGKITIYSSHPIENGVFVTPSKMEAKNYDGDNKIYSKEVNLNDVAWIDSIQGQYATTENSHYSKNNQSWQQYLEENFKSNGTRTDMKLLPVSNKIAEQQKQKLIDRAKAIEETQPDMVGLVDELKNNYLKDYEPKNYTTYDEMLKQFEKNSNMSYNETEREVIVNGQVGRTISTYESQKDDTQNGNRNERGISRNQETTRRTRREVVRDKFKEYPFKNKDIDSMIENLNKLEKYAKDDIYNILNDYRDIELDISDANTINEIKSIRNEIKETPLYIDNTIRHDIVDFGDYQKKKMLGKIKSTRDNTKLSVDQYYIELSNAYPNYFDPDIINPTDQLMTIVDFMNNQKLYKPQTETYTLTNDDLKDLVDTIQEEYSNTEDSNKSSIILPKTSAERITDMERPKVPIANKTRKFYRSVIESSNTSAEAKKISRKLTGYDTYQVQGNKQTLEIADRNIEQAGADDSLKALTIKINNNDKITAVDVAIGERLMEYYSKIGDEARLQEAIQNTAMAGTEAGQAVQAFAMLNHMTPQGQVLWIQRSIDKVNKRMMKEGRKAQFDFTADMQQKILNSTEENLSKNVDEVYKELGQQVPKSHMEQYNEWRYFSMLFNPKTHIRNILGNIVMSGVQQVKNKVAGTIEGLVLGDQSERWNSLNKVSKETYEFAKQDVKSKDVESLLGLNEDKYNPQNRLQQSQRTFKSNVLENTLGKLFKLNSNLLTAEDGIGLKSMYKKALANYITANNIDVNNMSKQDLQKARNYAVQQAKEATFHQYSALANTIQTWENKNLLTKIVIGGAVPFKKTPINVAITGFNYSPAGFIKTLTVDAVNLRKGKITANQYIDNISKNLTGTGIALLGYALTQAGVLKASGGDDDDKENYEEAQGKQKYSLQIGDNTYSLDWLTPAGIPLFIGSELYQIGQSKAEEKGKGNNQNEILKSVSNILDSTATAMNPMSEMSMISGLTSALKSYQQGSTQALGNIGTNMVKSYVTQAVPTALGQVARTMDNKERSTTTTQTNPFSKAVDSAKNQIMSKVPGLRQLLPVTTDVWGNEKKQDKGLIENAVLPWTRKQITTNNTDKELTRLYDATGDSSVIPDTYISKTLTLAKEKYRLTNKEYADLKKQYGQTSYNILSNLIASSDYKKMTDEQKVKSVEEAYKYGKASLKVTYADWNNLDVDENATYKKVQNVIQNGGDAKDYFTYVGITNGMSKDREKITALRNSSIKTKDAIYQSTVGKDDKTYQVMKYADTNINDYLDFKLQDFSADREDDGTEKGKAISGSSKKKLYNWLAQSNMSYEQRLMLTGTKYVLLRVEKDTLNAYIQSLDLTYSQKKEIYSELQGSKIMQDGSIYY